ncbi:hypothetical protein QFZ22_000199 [Streptomyces canus]|uniref:Uncharacterized protein n=1 Tax=Streptomyces canus TaxID=58343 RepID=A0AAW8F369_9ACTN|nr:hypothetical protein [Streptomyces canus]
MTEDGYRDLRVPDDSGRPVREEVALLVYAFYAIADECRTRADYLQVADNMLDVAARRELLSPEATDRAVALGRPAPPAERPRPAPS